MYSEKEPPRRPETQTRLLTESQATFHKPLSQVHPFSVYFPPLFLTFPHPSLLLLTRLNFFHSLPFSLITITSWQEQPLEGFHNSNHRPSIPQAPYSFMASPLWLWNVEISTSPQIHIVSVHFCHQNLSNGNINKNSFTTLTKHLNLKDNVLKPQSSHCHIVSVHKILKFGKTKLNCIFVQT